MSGIPPELTSSALTALAILGTWFGTWLARKGKREDNRIEQNNQSFGQLLSLADARLAEIQRLSAELERVRTSWEARWDRQMRRCRKVTDSLADAIRVLQRQIPGATQPTAEAALQALEEHELDDHDTGDAT